jgi:hypothetical protein
MKAIQSNRPVIVGAPLVCLLVTLVPIGIAMWLFAQEQYYFLAYNRDPVVPSAQTVLAFVIAFIVYVLADAAARVFVIPGVSRAILGERITLAKALGISRSRIGHVLLLYLLIALIGVAGIVGVSIVFAVIASAGSASAAGILLFLLIVGLIPLIFMASVIANIAIAAIVLEKASALASLRRAMSLVKGSAWRLTGNILVIQIVVGIISQVVTNLAATILGTSLGSTSSINATAIMVVVVAWLSVLMSAILSYAFVGTVTTLMYVDLRIRKEGFDIDLARAAEAAARR